MTGSFEAVNLDTDGSSHPVCGAIVGLLQVTASQLGLQQPGCGRRIAAFLLAG